MQLLFEGGICLKKHGSLFSFGASS